MATQRICSIPDCGKPFLARGWCAAHYWRWQKYGTPTGGGPTSKEISRYFNEVVLAYEGDECLPWPFGKAGSGYGYIKHKLVHRRVCEEVNGPPPTPKHEAAHSCGNGHLACCAKRHLSWKTRQENFADKILHGTSSRGEQSHFAKLTRDDVMAIRSMKGKKSQRQLAVVFGVSHEAIGKIHRGENWGWL